MTETPLPDEDVSAPTDKSTVPWSFVISQSTAYLAADISFFLSVALMVTVFNASAAMVGAMAIVGAAIPLVAPVIFTGLTESGDPVQKLRGTNVIRASTIAIFLVVAALLPKHAAIIFIVLIGIISVNNFVAEVSVFRAIPDLIREDRVDWLNGTLETIRSSCGIIGPIIGGFLMASLDWAWPMSVDGILFAIAAILLVSSHRRVPSRVTTEDQREADSGVSRLPLIQGIRAINANSQLRGVACTSALFNIFGYMMMVVEPIFIYRTVGLSPKEFGFCLSIGGVGGLCGGALASRVKRESIRKTMTISLVVAALAQGVQVFATGSGMTSMMFVAGGAFFAESGAVCYVALNAGVRQRSTPAHLRGRVGGAYIWMTRGLAPIGAILGTILLHLVNSRVAVLVATACMMTGAIAFNAMVKEM